MKDHKIKNQNLQKKHKSSKSNKDYKHQKSLKKDPGVPNLAQVKNEMILELKRKKPTTDRVHQLKKLMKKGNQSFEEYINHTTSQTLTYTEPEPEKNSVYIDSSRKSYFKDLLKVVESADIILEVLDARDPLGYKSQELENKVLSYGSKKLILVLNKIDLVPGDIIQAWHSHLSHSFPCVLFRSNIQEQQSHLSSAKFFKSSANNHFGREMLETNKTLGTEALMNLIKNYMRSGDIKKAVTVGVVGYPNVGKSSVINSLRRARAVGVSSTPGFTKCIQEVEIESNIKILDSPGIVFDKNADPDMVLRNVLKIDNIDDFIGPVGRILQKVPSIKIREIYGIEEFTDAISCLGNLARKRGKLKKGGVTDIEAAGKIILHDWVTGKIPYYTPPPNMMVD